jgi:3-oxoacyl-[acyl-carrier-protein] synthase II
MREVVITGLGAVTPLGVGARTLHERWAAGTVGIVDGLGQCLAFNATDFMSTKEARRADRFTQFALAATDEAIAEAGWSDGELPYAPGRIGCIIGTGIGGISTVETNHTKLAEGGPAAVSPLAVPLMMSNAASGAISMRNNLRGPSYGTVSACAAGAHAIGAAMRAIQVGDADAVVTGGSEAALTPLARAAFASLSATSESGISRPFDARRDGFVMGEGAGALVLEARDLAEARGATILGRVVGYGATSDAFHLTAPRADGGGAAAAMQVALDDAGVTPSAIDYINAHGTSTPLNDAAETAAIKQIFGDDAGGTPVSSLKSAIGHLLGAAGAVEAVATVLALRDGIAPPTIGWAEREPGLDLDYVPLTKPLRDTPGRFPMALSNSFGFGGHNVVLCLEAA